MSFVAISWCERNAVCYIVGIAKNDALLRSVQEPMQCVEELAKRTGMMMREFFEFYYAAGT
jgi:hypothetical protein